MAERQCFHLVAVQQRHQRDKVCRRGAQHCAGHLQILFEDAGDMHVCVICLVPVVGAQYQDEKKEAQHSDTAENAKPLAVGAMGHTARFMVVVVIVVVMMVIG
jgi:hypothetical protein